MAALIPSLKLGPQVRGNYMYIRNSLNCLPGYSQIITWIYDNYVVELFHDKSTAIHKRPWTHQGVREESVTIRPQKSSQAKILKPLPENPKPQPQNDNPKLQRRIRLGRIVWFPLENSLNADNETMVYDQRLLEKTTCI